MVLIFCKEKEEGSTDKSSAWTGKNKGLIVYG